MTSLVSNPGLIRVSNIYAPRLIILGVKGQALTHVGGYEPRGLNGQKSTWKKSEIRPSLLLT